MFRNIIFSRTLKTKTADTDQRLFIYVLSVIVGLLSALSAALLKNTIHYTHLFISGLTSHTGSYFNLAFPLIGIFITVLFVKFVVRDNIGHGISRILYAISKRKSRLRSHNTWTSLVASTITIGFGGSVGAEAPIVLTGSSIGSYVGRFFKLNYRNITLLIGCGAAGAISGIFKAPVAGIVFTLEVLMLDLTTASIVPLLISSVTAASVAYFLMGDTVLFSFSVKGSFIVANIPWYIVLGLTCGFISVYFTRMTLMLESGYERIKDTYLKCLIGGVVLGLLVFVFPPFFGEGYDTIMALLQGNKEILSENSWFGQMNESYWAIVIFMICLIFFKVIATSSTNGAGGVGGIFAPVLFIGGINGYVVASLLNRFTDINLPDNRFVLAGMAGMMAGVMHAPLTAIFLIAEITGGYDLLIPLIITSTISYITIRGFERHSIYHVQLAKRGELITHDKDKAVLTLMDWKKDIETDLLTVSPSDTLGDLIKKISKSNRNIYPVVDEYNILEGVVSLDDVREIMFNTELYNEIKMRDIMTIPPSYIDKSEGIDSVMESFESTGAWNLPVLDNGYYAGFISKARIFSSYRDLLVEFSEE